MAFWLLKTEPTVYSFEKLLEDKRTLWDGVTAPAALKNIRSMKKGDRVIVYHTGNVKAAVGLAQVASDPRAPSEDPKLAVFDLKPERPLKTPVTLAQVKAHSKLAGFELVRQPRLSVVPVSDDQWKELMALAKEK